MLYPKKVKYRKWQKNRQNPKFLAPETRGTDLSFGSFGLKAVTYNHITSNQIESARKVIARSVGKTGRVWIRVFPDRPWTQKAAEVPMGKGKGDPQGFCVEIRPGRIIFEVDGIPEVEAREALRKAGTKLPLKGKVVSRAH
ncbi:MAG: large subunit ribosomal protein [Patescibacteria group bacterium]|mgnify:FL=1|jgi:large subunit ribosomal protein L16|nr:large subunit ribosomal protein [Patescibacteria group bacterium]